MHHVHHHASRIFLGVYRLLDASSSLNEDLYVRPTSSVGPSVRQPVGNAFSSNTRRRVFLTYEIEDNKGRGTHLTFGVTKLGILRLTIFLPLSEHRNTKTKNVCLCARNRESGMK